MANPARCDWIPALKASLKNAGIPRGWSVSPSAGKVRLRVRAGAGGSAGQWSRTLPIEWEIGCIGPTTELLSKLHLASREGQTLDEAWKSVHGTRDKEGLPGVAAPLGIRWRELARSFFRDREVNGTQIGSKTMDAEQRYINAALRILEQRDPPDTPYTLISRAIEQWREKPTARKQAVEAIMRMLEYGTAHAGLDQRWVITRSEKKKLVGKPAPKKDKATLTDQQILELIDSCPSPTWRTALALMATYGLRPEELLHIEVRTNHASSKSQFWCTYEKPSGIYRTKQRWLHAVPLRDKNGQDCFTELVAGWDAGILKLPPLAERGEAVSQYLRRLPAWNEWRKAFLRSGKVLRPYTLRDSYSLRAHLRGIPSAQVAHGMGHSDQCHCNHYVWATEDTTTAAFERALQSY